MHSIKLDLRAARWRDGSRQREQRSQQPGTLRMKNGFCKSTYFIKRNVRMRVIQMSARKALASMRMTVPRWSGTVEQHLEPHPCRSKLRADKLETQKQRLLSGQDVTGGLGRLASHVICCYCQDFQPEPPDLSLGSNFVLIEQSRTCDVRRWPRRIFLSGCRRWAALCIRETQQARLGSRFGCMRHKFPEGQDKTPLII